MILSWSGFDLVGKEKTIVEMELAASSPGYWDDAREAQRKMQELGRIKDTVSTWRGLQSRAGNLFELTELAMEEGDDSLQSELEEEGKEISDALSKHCLLYTSDAADE